MVATAGGAIRWSHSPLDAIFTRAGEFPMSQTSGSARDAAVVLTLQSGAYSAVVSGGDGAVGDAMIEIYDVP